MFKDTRTPVSVVFDNLEAGATVHEITTDKNIRYQQNLSNRRIAVVVLGNQQWPVLLRYVDRVVEAVNSAVPASYVEVDVPFE